MNKDSQLIVNLNKASLSLKVLLDKLEKDGHLLSKNDLSVSEFVFNDIAAFAMLPVINDLDINSDDASKLKAKEYLELLSASIGIAVNETAFNDFLMQYYKRLKEQKDLYPESFLLINKFDREVENSEFYSTMGVKNPGHIVDYLIIIFEAIANISSEEFGTESVINEFIDISIKMMNNY